MENIKIKVTNKETGEVFITEDFYWFEEQGISNIKTTGECVGTFREYKIEFINLKPQKE